MEFVLGFEHVCLLVAVTASGYVCTQEEGFAAVAHRQLVCLQASRGGAKHKDATPQYQGSVT